MAKLLNTASFITQSSPLTPSSGFGTLYASSGSVFFKNNSGVDYNLSIVGSSSINIYTSSATWTKPSGIQYIKVICGGPGGGGGAGRVATDGSTRAGGDGGGGGDLATAYYSSASLIGTTYNLNIPGGGAGGLRTTSNTVAAGGSGTTPGTCSFSTGSTILLAALGGIRGRGGAAGGAGPAHIAPTTATTPNIYPPFYLSGVDGGTDTGGGFADAGVAFNGVRGLAGGGSGGRIFASNVPSRGGSGSAIYNYNILTPSGSPGAAVGGVGSNGAPVIDILSILYTSGSVGSSSIRIGTGGHGGGSGNSPAPFTVSGGDGGSGSLGAGGGGGGGAGAALNTVFSGRGGPGGGGFIIIFEYY